MPLVKIPGTTFVRDTDSMALLNRDASGLEEYKNKRKAMEIQKQEINNVKCEMDDLKKDMADIKSLLIKLLEGSNG